MSNTVNNSIPFVPENTIDPAAGLNGSLLTVDALLQLAVVSVGDNTPPGSPANGARHVVGTAPTGAWAAGAGAVAQFLDGAWRFYAARYVLNLADGLMYVRQSTAWITYAGPATAWGSITGTLSAQTDLASALGDKANTADLGSAAFTESSEYATSAQGALADTAVQPSDLASYERLMTAGANIAIDRTDPDNPVISAEITGLTGAWVDLRPYLKSGYYFDSVRNGRNSHPRIRKLSCGRVELDGVISFNATSGPVPIGVFVNVPAEFRPPLTAGGLMFGDTESPLSFGACNWAVTGQVEYSPPRVHGDIMMIPLTLASPAQNGAISINGIHWFT